MSNKLIEFWSKFKPRSAELQVHPADHEWFQDNRPDVLKQKLYSFDSFVKGARLGAKTDKELHLSLLPSPFHGNLANSKILILLMNPGFIPSDYYADQDPAFRAACISNLRQTNGKSQFPFFGLNPMFAWSGAYQWAEPHFRMILQRLQEELKRKKGHCTYYEALACLSKQIAIVELVPYHSSSGQAISSRVWNRLPSAETAREYVEERRLSEYPPLIIVARSHEKWNIPKQATRNIVVCPRTRGITFNPELREKSGEAGRRILEHLGYPTAH